jgi:hypothetical protein
MRDGYSSLQTVSDRLANKGDFEPTISANLSGFEPTIFTNEPKFKLWAEWHEVKPAGESKREAIELLVLKNALCRP